MEVKGQGGSRKRKIATEEERFGFKLEKKEFGKTSSASERERIEGWKCMCQNILFFLKGMARSGQVKERKKERDASSIVENTACTARILQQKLMFDSDDESEVPQSIKSLSVLPSPSPLPTITRTSATQLETDLLIFIARSSDMTSQPHSLLFDINGDDDGV